MMRIIKFTAAAVLAFGLASGSAFAQQEGLVNVSVDGNVVQVPIGVAVQACGIDISVIQEAAGTEEVACEIDQETAAEHNIRGQHGGGNGGQQRGLVNVSVDDNVVQVPIGVAAQVCGVEVAVIQEATGTDEVVCDIDQETAAEHNIRGQHGQGQGRGRDNAPGQQQ